MAFWSIRSPKVALWGIDPLKFSCFCSNFHYFSQIFTNIDIFSIFALKFLIFGLWICPRNLKFCSLDISYKDFQSWVNFLGINPGLGLEFNCWACVMIYFFYSMLSSYFFWMRELRQYVLFYSTKMAQNCTEFRPLGFLIHMH